MKRRFEIKTKRRNVPEITKGEKKMYYSKPRKARSNADLIRSMSDEELKKFICSMFKCEFCDFELGERCGLLNWLQQPAGRTDDGKEKQ